MSPETESIQVRGASENNLKNLNVVFPHRKISVVTGVSGSGKSSLVFDTVLTEAQRRFFYTLSHYSRQFLSTGTRPSFRSIAGLSPAIGLAQNETIPSARASVGSFTDLTELLGVLFSRFADAACPEHGLPTVAQSPGDIADRLLAGEEGQLLMVCAPVAAKKKGSFRQLFSRFSEKGYLRILTDGKLQSLTPLPVLDPEKRHDISLVIDHLRVDQKKKQRLMRSLVSASEEGGGFIECQKLTDNNRAIPEKTKVFSLKGGCPECGYSWPALDPRYFSPNSLGRCSQCRGTGAGDQNSKTNGVAGACAVCDGTGLDRSFDALTFHQRSASSLHSMSLDDLNHFFKELPENGQAFSRLRSEILKKTDQVCRAGLGYLQLRRRLKTLSGGELQRLKLANLIEEQLRGVLYILDEPGQGLHPTELHKVMNLLCRLRDRGNTVIMVDHHPEMIRKADWIIDMGPGGGPQGGEITGMFTPESAAEHLHHSATARVLCDQEPPLQHVKHDPDCQEFISIRNAGINNLNIEEALFLKGAMNVVCGVSGSGKSSLVINTLYESGAEGSAAAGSAIIEGLDEFESVELLDRSPLAKSSVSMPATWLNVFTDIRKMYEKLPDAQVAGISMKDFSLLSKGGRCEACQGKGQIILQMKFLADAAVPCGECQGQRYQPHILGVRYRGLSVAETLSLTLDEALIHFRNFPRIVKKLSAASALGLGYLSLGQPSTGLSGGESQRLKLAPLLGKKNDKKRLLIMDEPSRGLHFSDVAKLITVFRRLVSEGCTLVMIDHHWDILRASDWMLEIGPGAAKNGGKVIRQGPPWTESPL